MKLTKELKKQIDNKSVGSIAAMFRFHPSDYTTGKTGKYLAQKLKEKLDDEREENNEDRVGWKHC